MGPISYERDSGDAATQVLGAWKFWAVAGSNASMRRRLAGNSGCAAGTAGRHIQRPVTPIA